MKEAFYILFSLLWLSVLASNAAIFFFEDFEQRSSRYHYAEINEGKRCNKGGKDYVSK